VVLQRRRVAAAITREATFGEVDRSKRGLIELPAQERLGLIWMVDRAGAPIDVAGWLGPEMDEILAGYRLGELTAIRSEGFDEPANWKLMQDGSWTTTTSSTRTRTPRASTSTPTCRPSRTSGGTPGW